MTNAVKPLWIYPKKEQVLGELDAKRSARQQNFAAKKSSESKYSRNRL